MDGRAVAPAAGTVVNAIATGHGAAFAIDLETTATVELTSDGDIRGTVADAPDADTELVEQCVRHVFDAVGDEAGLDRSIAGARIRTESAVPMAAGLKSSSAAANATVLATLDALDCADAMDPIDACRLGVEAARAAGVTITGAFDDASASMLGGVTVTNNTTDELGKQETVDWDVLVYTPPDRAFSAAVDVTACERVAPMAELAIELASEGRFVEAMTVNGFVFSATLGYDPDPLLAALPDAAGASLSGTGPSFVAVGDAEALDAVERDWTERPGTTIRTTTRTKGATIV
ncbi:shikimate kinase [Halovivax ruber XH-70]|uniref:Shikimate kinase n=1 Tax=Halovivax ruber (strain DSM 18193 / JCM 13892 / XH-70) TaxID=797302 RepID=L0IBI9_HALRX|nr:shikimate kinase [Halovivax ruber]AGB16188.1 shikimate kinase [Halovivax ruber XH-70]